MRMVFGVMILLLVPVATHAAVTFSEIAWMGSAASANAEWIEFSNDGAAVDVTGWVVRDGMNLEIPLYGVIPEGGVVVLERTNDDSTEGTAFLIYTGALVNTGATLQLVRADGTLEDQVSGGEDWGLIGGDNVTKETAQYTSGGWVTALPTPGRLITSQEVPVVSATPTPSSSPTTNSVTSGSVRSKSNSGESVVLTLPDMTLKLAVTAQKVGYVHQPISFSVEPSGIGKTLIDSLQYEWNFGDGTTAATKDSKHSYDYEGTYVVTVYGGFKRQEQVARHEITILPVAVSLTTNAAGDVQVNNDSPYEIDLSGFRLKATEAFTFSPRTVLLPNQTITIARKKLGVPTAQFVALYDTKQALIASLLPESNKRKAIVPESPMENIAAVSNFSAAPVAPTTFGFFETAAAQEVGEDETAVSEAIEEVMVGSSTIEKSGAASLASDERWTYYAMVIVILLGIFGVYAAPRRNEIP